MDTTRQRRPAISALALCAIVLGGCPLFMNGGGYLVYPLSLELPASQDTATVNVTNYCSANGTWTATPSEPWLTVTPNTGSGDYTQVAVTVTRPATKDMQIGENTANIRFAFTGGIQNVPVTAWVWPDDAFEESFDEGTTVVPPKQSGGLISYEYFNDVEVSPDGGYVAVGFIDQFYVSLDAPKSGQTKQAVLYNDAYVVKTDTAGQEVWSINWGADGSDEAYAVVVADDGNYVVGGWQVVGADPAGKDSAEGVYAQLTKVSPDGAILWQKQYGVGHWSCWGLKKTADGGFILTGDNYGDASASVYVPFLVKTDADGNVEWSKQYDSFSYDHFIYGVEVAADGGYVVVGESFPPAAADKRSRPVKRPRDGEKQYDDGDLFLMKTIPNGTLQWAGDFGGEGDQSGRDVVALPGQSGYAACGSNAAGGSVQAYLLKVDLTGEVEWPQTYVLGSESGANAIVRDSAGNYVLAGWAVNGTKQTELSDGVLLKTDRLGSPQWVEYHSTSASDWFGGVRIAPDSGFVAAGGSEITNIIVLSDGYLVKTDENGEVTLAP